MVEGSTQPVRECEGTHMSCSTARPGQQSRSRLCSWLRLLHCCAISLTDFPLWLCQPLPKVREEEFLREERTNGYPEDLLLVGAGREPIQRIKLEFCHLGLPVGKEELEGAEFCRVGQQGPSKGSTLSTGSRVTLGCNVWTWRSEESLSRR